EANCVARLGTLTPAEAADCMRTLSNALPGFAQLRTTIAAARSIQPPSGAMAGVWARNDQVSGVWNAPANTGIVMLTAPTLPITDAQQDGLNVPPDGLAVNAIRTFIGRGATVWGARTLDGNSSDWRYIPVRRTVIYVEQSVRQALQSMVFQPNDARTWSMVSAMLGNFLHGMWAGGGLFGSKPSEAYAVQCGMGVTMTGEDVLNGVLRVQLLLAMTRPAEFIVLSFEQQMASA
ncbi:MAG: phage tail sheath family protein, partial [Sphingomonadales bacterium]